MFGLSLLDFFKPRAKPRLKAAALPEKGRTRRSVDHVIIIDGTMASLRAGERSHAGRLFRLINSAGRRPTRTLWYDEGIPWRGWRRILDVIEGRGVEDQIIRAYSHLASTYRPGDRIFLFGYSRGAFAVRSLAGMIDRVGLLRREHATERNIRLTWRYYQERTTSPAAQAFSQAFCYPETRIRMIGVWETVKALGLRVPLFWMMSEGRHEFHDPDPVRHLDYACQALALNETRVVFKPILWRSPTQAGQGPQIEQVWFRGTHSDIGGQTGPIKKARPLANIPLVWMLDRAERAGLELPSDWRQHFPCNPSAPMVSTWTGVNCAFLYRRKRRCGEDPSERLHESVPLQDRARWTGGARPEVAQAAVDNRARGRERVERGGGAGPGPLAAKATASGAWRGVGRQLRAQSVKLGLVAFSWAGGLGPDPAKAQEADETSKEQGLVEKVNPQTVLPGPSEPPPEGPRL